MIFFGVLCIIIALLMFFLSFCNFYSFKSYKDKPETYSAMLRNGVLFLLVGLFAVGGAIYIFYTNSELNDYTPSNSNNDYSYSYDSKEDCRYPGCTRDAVTTGDSVYCYVHSNRCGNCGCYIDGDAMFCMDCIRDALS